LRFVVIKGILNRFRSRLSPTVGIVPLAVFHLMKKRRKPGCFREEHMEEVHMLRIKSFALV